MKVLNQLGWRNYSSTLENLNDYGQVGRVRRVDRGEADVLTEEGDVRVASDSQRSPTGLAPATGDWVKVIDDPDVGLRIAEILPRYSAIVRRDPAEVEKEQVLVSNIDYVGITCSADRPANIAKVERFLVLAQGSGATPLFIMAKVDQGLTEEWKQILQQIKDVMTIETSAITGQGIDQIKTLISADHSLVLLGESGVGKSTLVNVLVGETVQETTAVRNRDSKGRHTTVARELIILPTGGVLIDTPGIRGIGLWDARNAVEQVFSEISELTSECRFTDCTHQVEPDCAVQAAVQVGELDKERLDRYFRLKNELDEQEERLAVQRRKSR